MRTRSSFDDHVADVTRRRLAALTAELAAARGELPEQPALTAELAAAPGEGVEQVDDPKTADRDPAGRRGDPVPPGRHARLAVPLGRRILASVVDHAPAGLRDGPHLGSAQVGLVALVVAVGLALSAWWLVRAGGIGGEPGDVVPPRVAAPATSTGSSVPAGPGSSTSAGPVTSSSTVPPSSTAQPTDPGPSAPSPTATGERIVVDVVGKVRRPGIAVLPVGSRVVDAVRAAGGVRPGVDPATVNMARPLTDGEQVVVGGPPPSGGALGLPPPAAPGAATTALVNLNTADQAALESLPGVGPVTAAAILQWRTEHGAFTAVDELLEVSGIGDATLAEIAPHVTL